MGDRPLPDPERNSTIRRGFFEIVDNQRRLLGAVDEELGSRSTHLNLELSPLTRHQVDIGLVFARAFTPELIPWEPRNRHVLGRMVPLQLVFRSSILGPNVETLEVRTIPHMERDPNETAQLRRSIRRGIARDGRFNGAVPKRCSVL